MASLRRSLWRVALLLSGLWLLPVLLIHAQPFDDGGLRDFLVPPEGCPAPCFMGIRPGAMTANEAAAQLGRQTWVLRHRRANQSIENYAQLNWWWHESAPAWIDPQGLAFVGLSSDRVLAIYVVSTIRRADMLLAFGRPDQSRWLSADALPLGYEAYDRQYQGWYGDLGLLILANGVCAEGGSSYVWSLILHFQAEAPDFSAAARRPLLPCRALP
jgi:hypothetical protein